MLAAAIPMCLLVVQAMPAPGANSSLIAASIHFDGRPKNPLRDYNGLRFYSARIMR